MRKVLKWGVVPLNLEGHGMDPHSFSWARINSPVNIRRFNSTLKLKILVISFCSPEVGLSYHVKSADQSAPSTKLAVSDNRLTVISDFRPFL